MDTKKQPRKKRSDRNHAIYVITNTVTNQQYVGVTACSGSIRKALRVRMQKHIRRAFTENKEWELCENIRQHGVNSFEYGIIELVRGKRNAHAREREITKIAQPELNTL